MAQLDEKKSKKKLIRHAALVVLVLTGIAIILSGMDNRKQVVQPASPPSDLPRIKLPEQKPAKPTSTPGSKTHKDGSAKKTRDHAVAAELTAEAKDAVNAAVLADANLTLAQFQTPAQRRLIINSTVAPSLRARFDKAYRYTGQALAVSYFGYKNVDEARSYSAYSVTTMMFRVEHLTPSSTKVALFDFSRFRTRDDLSMGVEHKDVGITVLKLQKVAGKWLLVSTSDGPGPRYAAGQHVTFQSKLAAYQPYLRGFTRYGSS